MILENNQIKHGTESGYSHHNCRCDKCKKAKSDYRKNSPILNHGTKWYYDKGCRCDLCVNAKMAYRRKSHPPTRRITTNLSKMTRICYSCHEEKPLEDFGRNRNRKISLGRQNECKLCHNRRSREHKNTPGHRYSTYVSGAKVRKIQFDLSYEEFIQFWNKPCWYCGESIEGIGLDRNDPKKGYQLENVVSCCCRCNRAKTIQTTEQFISMCLLVSKRFENHIVPQEGGILS